MTARPGIQGESFRSSSADAVRVGYPRDVTASLPRFVEEILMPSVATRRVDTDCGQILSRITPGRARTAARDRLDSGAGKVKQGHATGREDGPDLKAAGAHPARMARQHRGTGACHLATCDSSDVSFGGSLCTQPP